ncbi:MAG: hypothetical protein ACREPM_18670 [Gemmatimonadaceae bacterium]
MTRRSDWQIEVADALIGERWSLQGPRRVVKVVRRPPPQPDKGETFVRFGGYFTVESSLYGLTPYEMQRALGLPLGHLKGGCCVFAFTRLPTAGEWSDELTAKFPDGLAFDAAIGRNERVMRRLRPSKTHNPIFREGSDSIPQWKLKVTIAATLLRTLDTAEPFPYPWK